MKVFETALAVYHKWLARSGAKRKDLQECLSSLGTPETLWEAVRHCQEVEEILKRLPRAGKLSRRARAFSSVFRSILSRSYVPLEEAVDLLTNHHVKPVEILSSCEIEDATK